MGQLVGSTVETESVGSPVIGCLEGTIIIVGSLVGSPVKGFDGLKRIESVDATLNPHSRARRMGAKGARV